jgi:hypothetical protein
VAACLACLHPSLPPFPQVPAEDPTGADADDASADPKQRRDGDSKAALAAPAPSHDDSHAPHQPPVADLAVSQGSDAVYLRTQLRRRAVEVVSALTHTPDAARALVATGVFGALLRAALAHVRLPGVVSHEALLERAALLAGAWTPVIVGCRCCPLCATMSCGLFRIYVTVRLPRRGTRTRRLEGGLARACSCTRRLVQCAVAVWVMMLALERAPWRRIRTQPVLFPLLSTVFVQPRARALRVSPAPHPPSC